jgi:hypothetical protein
LLGQLPDLTTLKMPALGLSRGCGHGLSAQRGWCPTANALQTLYKEGVRRTGAPQHGKRA